MTTNLVWTGLSGEHAGLGAGNALAKPFRPDIAPFGAVLNQSEQAKQAMLALLQPGDQVCLIGQSLNDMAEVEPTSQSFAHQMYYRATATISAVDADTVTELSIQDVPQMVALTDLVFPGYFRRGTIRMGKYFGIFDGRKLVAMAGERLTFPGHREISRVCTHPDYQRRGYALHLVNLLIQRITGAGERPFLHVGEHNSRALVMYQRLGFLSEHRAAINLYKRVPL